MVLTQVNSLRECQCQCRSHYPLSPSHQISKPRHAASRNLALGDTSSRKTSTTRAAMRLYTRSFQKAVVKPVWLRYHSPFYPRLFAPGCLCKRCSSSLVSLLGLCLSQPRPLASCPPPRSVRPCQDYIYTVCPSCSASPPCSMLAQTHMRTPYPPFANAVSRPAILPNEIAPAPCRAVPCGEVEKRRRRPRCTPTQVY